METTEYKVIKADTVWHVDPSQGVKGSDKVYSVQLVQHIPTSEYRVESQYGKRGSNLKSAPTFATTSYLNVAERAYQELLQKKVLGKNGDAYDRKLSGGAIIPTQFGGAGFSRAITKEAELKTAKQVDSLYDFLSGALPVVEEKVSKPKKEKVNEGLAAMLAAFGDD